MILNVYQLIAHHGYRHHSHRSASKGRFNNHQQPTLELKLQLLLTTATLNQKFDIVINVLLSLPRVII